MSEPNERPAEWLLSRVRRRLYARTLLGRVTWALVVGALVGVAVLLAGRLTGKLSVEETRWALAIAPAAAALLTLLVTRPPAKRAAASEIDAAGKTGDLFLTSVSVDADGGFVPVVQSEADRKAGDLADKPIVRPWERVRMRWVVAAIVAALAADFFTPVLDPFGVVAEAEASAKQKLSLQRDIEATQDRKAQLTKRDPESELSPEVDDTLQKLLNELPNLTPKNKPQRDKAFKAAQKDFGRLFDKVSERMTEQMLSKDAAGRRFGGETAKKFAEWKKELQNGKTESLKDEFKELQDLLKQADAAETAEQREKALAQAEKKLTEMKKFAEQELGSQELAQAMERALRQMNAARNEEMSEQAMQALSESTELSEQETEALAQAMRDMESIKEALETLQKMKNMKGQQGEGFDGSECEDCQTLSDYAEYYRQMMAGQDGMGTGGEGQGDSESVEEDPDVEAGFVKKKTDTKLQKGRMLMSLKGKGDGTLNEDEVSQFKQAVKEIAQDASEAVETENIPPGYRDGIKRYFKSVEESGGEQ